MVIYSSEFTISYLIFIHDELTEILRILNSSLKWEGGEELYVGGGE